MNPFVAKSTGVSILVFVELALGVRRWSPWIRLFGVSILVFVELALGDRVGYDISDCQDVSILVFVELALGGCWVLLEHIQYHVSHGKPHKTKSRRRLSTSLRWPFLADLDP